MGPQELRLYRVWGIVGVTHVLALESATSPTSLIS
jgi:hypothetical protein